MRLTLETLDTFYRDLPGGVAYCDGDTRLVWANQRWREAVARHLDVTPDDITLGQPLFDLLPQPPGGLQRCVADALAGEIGEADELRLTADGDVFFWNVALLPAQLDDAPPGFLFFVSDVTDRVITQRLIESRMADSVRKLAALYAVASVAGGMLEWRAMLREALASTLDAVQANAGAIQLLDADGERLVLAAELGLPPGFVELMARRPADLGLPGWILSERRAATANLARDRRVSPLLRGSEFAMFAGVPMTVHGKAIGVLTAYREKRRPFRDADLDLLHAVADQIAVGVDNARLRQAHDRLLIAEERTRLARELHDAVTQSLHSLTLFAEAVQRSLAAGRIEQGSEYVGRIGETSLQALREMRLLLHNLRPAALQEVGLIGALRSRLEAVEGRAGMSHELIAPEGLDLPESVEAAIYRLIQEALNNALKHAAASHVTVRLHQDGRIVRISVADDGEGFDPSRVTRGGQGLASMRERIERLGGVLEIRSRPTAGTIVNVRLDLDRIPQPDAGFDLLGRLG